MQLEFKPDFEDAAAQWDAFWKGENTRPCVLSVIEKPGATSVTRPPCADALNGDYEPVIDQVLQYGASHEFLGDFIPHYRVTFAADDFASLLGGDLIFSETESAGWSVPCIEDLEHADIQFDRNGKWWRKVVEFTQALRARCDGKLIISGPEVSGNVDALAALYGSEKLLVAMVDNPDAVHRCLQQIDKAHGEVLDACAELYDYPTYGSITRHNMYSRGRLVVPQCDLSCMISQEMFHEFVLPYLTKEIQRLDACEYHLDGEGAIRHLEALCGIPGLGAIQWQPGVHAGKDWTWLEDKIDALGVGQIFGGDCTRAVEVWQTYKSRRLVYYLYATSRSEVEDCIEALNGKEGIG